jgi:hypothetical protein
MSDHRALIEQAREHYPSSRSVRPIGSWCFRCALDWPCITARLADALEQALNAFQETAEVGRIQVEHFERIVDQRDAALARADKADADHRCCAAFLEDAQIQLSIAREDLERASARAERLAGLLRNRETRWQEIATAVLEVYHVNSPHHSEDGQSGLCVHRICANWRREICSFAAALGLAAGEGQ